MKMKWTHVWNVYAFHLPNKCLIFFFIVFEFEFFKFLCSILFAIWMNIFFPHFFLFLYVYLVYKTYKSFKILKHYQILSTFIHSLIHSLSWSVDTDYLVLTVNSRGSLLTYCCGQIKCLSICNEINANFFCHIYFNMR